MLQGRIHSTESFGTLDGPGTRFIIFTQGCALRCRFCHNPDTWDCGAGEERTAQQLLDTALRFRPYWGAEGGITVSGGEPLLQPAFLLELFTLAKARGVHTCIDTAAQPFTRQEPFFGLFQKLMEVTDLLLMDVKHLDPDAHRRLTGQDNGNILDCFRYLDSIGKPIWVRQVLLPGTTDDPAYLRRLRAFLDSLGNVERREVLPYHTMGRYKWEAMGLTYPLDGVEPPTPEQVRQAEKILGCEQLSSCR